MINTAYISDINLIYKNTNLQMKLETFEKTEWLNYNIDKENIMKIVNEVKSDSQYLVVVGIGGSYLGTKAILKSLSPYFTKSNIIFAGFNESDEYLNDLAKFLADKDFAINLVTKSGTTREAIYTYNYLLNILVNKYSASKISNKVIITTEENNNLYNYAKTNNFHFLEIPKNIGGRFSCMTNVSLFPLLFAGVDIDNLRAGYKIGVKMHGDALKIANIRHNLYLSNKSVEVFTVYKDKLDMFSEWYKQLFAETQGKSYKGILPTSVINPRDLHSLGQYLQEGTRNFFEFMISFDDKIVTKIAEAHKIDGSEILILELGQLNAFNLGKLIGVLMLTSSYGAILLDVNPFDQPGVEKYKAILNK